LAAAVLPRPSHGAAGAEPELLQFFGPWNGVAGLAVSPDGSRLAALSLRTVRVWDSKERSETDSRPWAGSGLPGCTPIAFSPDGKLLLQGTEAYDLTTRAVRVKLDRASDPEPELFEPGGVAVSPDGKLLATYGGTLYHFQLKLWDLETGKWRRTLVPWSPGTSFLHSAAFSPDGARIAADVDGQVRIWEVASGKLLRTLAGPGGLTLDQVLYSPDGKTLAGAGYEVDTQRNATRRVLRLWDAGTGEVRRTIELGPYATTRGPVSLAFSPDGRRLAVSNGRVRFFRPETGEPAGALPENVIATRVLFFPNPPLRLAVGQCDGQVSVWKIPREP
jgi:WD40 repeat protein